jgi:hypothetical protein
LVKAETYGKQANEWSSAASAASPLERRVSLP